MNTSLEQELEELEISIYQGKYFDALERLDEIISIPDISCENKVRALNHINLAEFYLGVFVFEPERFQKGYESSLTAYEEVQKSNDKTLQFFTIAHLLWSKYRLGIREKYDEIRDMFVEIYEDACENNPEEAKKMEPLFLIHKSLEPLIAAFRGESVPPEHFEDSKKKTERALILSKEIDDLWALHGSLNNLAVFAYREGRRGDFHKYVSEHLKFWDDFGNKYGIASCYEALANHYLAEGDHSKYLDYMTKRLRLMEELKNDTGIAGHNTTMGVYYESLGKYDEALKYLKTSLKFFSEKDDKVRINSLSQFIGYIYRMKGDLLQALEYTEKMYEFCNKSRFEGWWHILPNLSAIYLLMGDVDKALQLEEENLRLHQTTQYSNELAFSLSRISMIYWQKGFEEKAISDAQKSLQLFEEMNNPLWTGDILANLVFLTSEFGQIQLAQRYNEELRSLVDESKDITLKRSYNFSEALILKTSTSQRDLLKAELLLENLLKEEISFPFRIRIMIALSDVFLQEIKHIDEKDNFENLKSIVKDLSSLAANKNSIYLTCQTIILQSKLAMVERKKANAEKLLVKALDLANNFNLDKLKKIIWKEQEKLEQDSSAIQQLHKDVKIIDIIDLLKIENGLEDLKKTSTSE